MSDFEHRLGIRINSALSENEKLHKRVVQLEMEQGAMIQDFESHKVFKKRQLEELTNEFNQLREFKNVIQRRCE